MYLHFLLLNILLISFLKDKLFFILIFFGKFIYEITTFFFIIETIFKYYVIYVDDIDVTLTWSWCHNLTCHVSI